MFLAGTGWRYFSFECFVFLQQYLKVCGIDDLGVNDALYVADSHMFCNHLFVSDIAVFVLRRDVKLQLTKCNYL